MVHGLRSVGRPVAQRKWTVDLDSWENKKNKMFVPCSIQFSYCEVVRQPCSLFCSFLEFNPAAVLYIVQGVARFNMVGPVLVSDIILEVSLLHYPLIEENNR